MSGPKGASYQVVSAAELERRALVQAHARLQDAVRRAETLAAEVAATAAVYAGQISTFNVPQTRSHTDSQTCAAVAAEVHRTVAAAHARFQEELSEARAAQLASTRSLQRTTAAREHPVRERREAPARTLGVGADLGEKVTKVLARLITSDEQTRAKIETHAADLLAEGSATRADLLLRVLQDEVQGANRSEQERKARRDVLDDLRIEVLGHSSTTLDELGERIDSLYASRAPFDEARLRAEVKTAVAAAVAEADRIFAVQTAVGCLEELGYEVSEGFDTVLAAGGVTYLRRATWPGYAVQLRVGDKPELGFNVVRDERVSASVRDTEVETAWCTDFERLQREAAGRGLDLTLTRATPPGVLAMQEVSSHKVQRGYTQTDARARKKARTAT